LRGLTTLTLAGTLRALACSAQQASPQAARESRDASAIVSTTGAPPEPKPLRSSGSTSYLAGAQDGEASAQAIGITGEDHQEGLRAFFDKRPSHFTGR
jgi:enoyl-CoA hydratase/carnithine racemase